ncbi:hypothetical protein ACFLU6_11595 [Acidobacteriota bacterium]
MAKKLILSTILGALVLFIWSFISHVAIPWYPMTMGNFSNEDAVGFVISKSTVSSGIYVYPGMEHRPGMTKEESKTAMERQMEKSKKGPVVFAAVNTKGITSWTPHLAVSFAINLITALLVSLLLLKAGFATYWSRVFCSVLIGFITFVVVHLQYWNWYSFNNGFTFVSGLDTVVGFFLMGLLVARFTKK